MTEVVDNQKRVVGGRLKEARAALGLTQKELCALIEKPLPSLRDYELGKSIPGGEAIAGLVRAGINANWLLTGDGPMLLAAPAPGQQQQQQSSPAPRINTDALETIIEGTIVALPKAAPAAIARQAVSFYLQCIDNELITPEGIGSGNMSNAA